MERYEKLVARYYVEKGFIVWIIESCGEVDNECADLLAINIQEKLIYLIRCENTKCFRENKQLSQSYFDDCVSKFNQYQEKLFIHTNNYEWRYELALSSWLKVNYRYAKKSFNILPIYKDLNGEFVYYNFSEARMLYEKIHMYDNRKFYGDLYEKKWLKNIKN